MGIKLGLGFAAIALVAWGVVYQLGLVGGARQSGRLAPSRQHPADPPRPPVASVSSPPAPLEAVRSEPRHATAAPLAPPVPPDIVALASLTGAAPAPVPELPSPPPIPGRPRVDAVGPFPAQPPRDDPPAPPGSPTPIPVAQTTPLPLAAPEPAPPLPRVRHDEQALLVQFTAVVSPIYEGGAVGPPVPYTVQIRGPGSKEELLAGHEELVATIRRELEKAAAEVQAPSGPEGIEKKLDLILRRLDKIERRLGQAE